MKDLNLKQYLLGLLPEPDQTELELSFLSDDEAYQQLLLAEDDLIEAYLQDELSTHEQERFHRIFLAHPERQQKLKLTQALIARASIPPTCDSPKVITTVSSKWWEDFWPLNWKFTATAALALMALTLGLLFIRQRPASMESLSATASPHRSETPLPTTAPVVGTKTYSAEPLSGQTMAIGTTIKEIILTPEYKDVHLQLWLDKDRWDTYKVTIQPPDVRGQELPDDFKRQTRKGLSFIEVTLPVAMLPTGEFILKLEGINEQGQRVRADHYSLKVKRN